jgi:hypothetical protein
MDEFVEAWWSNDPEYLSCPCCDRAVRVPIYNEDDPEPWLPPIHYLEKHSLTCLYRNTVEELEVIDD